MNDHINKKTEEALNSLDGIVSAEPKPFLLTRINAALQSRQPGDRSTWGSIAALLKRPAVAFGMLLLIAFINIAVLAGGNPFTEKKNTQSFSANTKYDFAINVSGIYDIENQEP